MANIAKVLLVDTTRWPCSARLALGLSKAGITVEIVCPEHHPILKTRESFQTHRYRAFYPAESLLAAMAASQPDLVVPCDDRAVDELHKIHERALVTDKKIARLIERSLGLTDSFSVVSGRNKFLALAREEGLRVPDTFEVSSPDSLKAWGREHSFPAVLKADGTWGGGGVRVSNSLSQAERHLQELRGIFSLRQGLTKLATNRDLCWLQAWWTSVKPAVVIQAHVEGRPANCAVFCWQGEVLGIIAVEALATTYENGPASIVSVIENSEMKIAAERIARRLGLSGFFGLDFMIEKQTGDAYLIEINPRSTPVCHLQLGPGRDLIEALRASVTDTPMLDCIPVTTRNLIAYFPQAWRAANPLLKDSFQDAPLQEEDLMEELLTPWPQGTLLTRSMTFLQRTKQRYTSGSTENAAVLQNEQSEVEEKEDLAKATKQVAGR